MSLLVLVAGLASVPGVRGDDTAAPTPPRLGFVDGEVSFWRPGAEQWTVARVNTPLAPGDALYAGREARLELQIGARAFVRADAETELGLESHEPELLRFTVSTGRVSIDLRTLPRERTIEVGTPNAVFTIERTGYYRVEVGTDTTTFVTRRGGEVAMVPRGGSARLIGASEKMVIEGVEVARVERYAAAEPDEWDRWNEERTDDLSDTESARYVPSGVYGVDALDRAGSWRVVSPYGPVWFPAAVPAGWAPYSSGSWLRDSYYGWAWIDDAPWGWAPCHYGRWVMVNGFWAWAPGPLVATPVYSPALVVFFGAGHHRGHVAIGVPAISWVALGWGEPLIPWWGPAGFIGVPWWGGWGGPFVVNTHVIHHHQPRKVHCKDVKRFRHAKTPGAVVTVRRDRFGRDHVKKGRIRQRLDGDRLELVRGALPADVDRGPTKLAPSGPGRRPRPDGASRAHVLTGPRPGGKSTIREKGNPRGTPPAAPWGKVVETRRPPRGTAGIWQKGNPEGPRQAIPSGRVLGAPRRAPRGESGIWQKGTREGTSPAAPWGKVVETRRPPRDTSGIWQKGSPAGTPQAAPWGRVLGAPRSRKEAVVVRRSPRAEGGAARESPNSRPPQRLSRGRLSAADSQPGAGSGRGSLRSSPRVHAEAGPARGVSPGRGRQFTRATADGTGSGLGTGGRQFRRANTLGQPAGSGRGLVRGTLGGGRR